MIDQRLNPSIPRRHLRGIQLGLLVSDIDHKRWRIREDQRISNATPEVPSGLIYKEFGGTMHSIAGGLVTKINYYVEKFQPGTAKGDNTEHGSLYQDIHLKSIIVATENHGFVEAPVDCIFNMDAHYQLYNVEIVPFVEYWDCADMLHIHTVTIGTVFTDTGFLRSDGEKPVYNDRQYILQEFKYEQDPSMKLRVTGVYLRDVSGKANPRDINLYEFMMPLIDNIPRNVYNSTQF